MSILWRERVLLVCRPTVLEKVTSDVNSTQIGSRKVISPFSGWTLIALRGPTLSSNCGLYFALDQEREFCTLMNSLKTTAVSKVRESLALGRQVHKSRLSQREMYSTTVKLHDLEECRTWDRNAISISLSFRNASLERELLLSGP